MVMSESWTESPTNHPFNKLVRYIGSALQPTSCCVIKIYLEVDNSRGRVRTGIFCGEMHALLFCRQEKKGATNNPAPRLSLGICKFPVILLVCSGLPHSRMQSECQRVLPFDDP